MSNIPRISDILDSLNKTGLTDYRISKMLGVSQSVIRKIRDREAISEELAYKLAKVTGADSTKLLLISGIFRNIGNKGIRSEYIKMYRKLYPR